MQNSLTISQRKKGAKRGKPTEDWRTQNFEKAVANLKVKPGRKQREKFIPTSKMDLEKWEQLSLVTYVSFSMHNQAMLIQRKNVLKTLKPKTVKQTLFMVIQKWISLCLASLKLSTFYFLEHLNIIILINDSVGLGMSLLTTPGLFKVNPHTIKMLISRTSTHTPIFFN